MPKLVVTFTREDFRAARANDLVKEVGHEFEPVDTREKRMQKRGYPAGRKVRRPEHGYIAFPDSESAISIVGRNGTARPLWARAGESPNENAFTAATGIHFQDTRTSDFILERVSIGSMERQQVVETFGEPYMFFFGEHVKVLRGSGSLINTVDYPWLTEWTYNWDTEFRGTKLVEHDARAYLKVGMVVYEGYFADYDCTQVAVDEYKVPFNFTFLVTEVIDIGHQMALLWENDLVLPLTVTPLSEKTADEKTQDLLARFGKAAFGAAYRSVLHPEQLVSDLSMSIGSVAFDALSSVELREAQLDGMTAAQRLGLDSQGNKGALSLGTVMNQSAKLAGKVVSVARTGNFRQGLAMGMGTAADIMTGMSTGKTGFDTPGGALVSNFIPGGGNAQAATIVPDRM